MGPVLNHFGASLTHETKNAGLQLGLDWTGSWLFLHIRRIRTREIKLRPKQSVKTGTKNFKKKIINFFSSLFFIFFYFFHICGPLIHDPNCSETSYWNDKPRSVKSPVNKSSRILRNIWKVQEIWNGKGPPIFLIFLRSCGPPIHYI